MGRIRRPHGLHGHVVVHPESDHPERFAPGSVVVTEAGRSLVVERAQPHDRGLLIRFEGVNDRAAAEAIAQTDLTIDPEGRRALDPDEYWPDELVGLEVCSVSGASLGVVEAVIEGVAQHRLRVRAPGGSFEVPFVIELVPVVDMAAGRLEVVDLPGLIPDA